ncbi:MULTISPECIES: Na+/H+ antiporter NhaC family protein [Tenacibaculum]|uniref:Na+/H+ antiporter NhaC family protein n=1 Tax=Tenacibaculum TaxID=104267 RepID=UPI001F0A5361|nr:MULTISPECIES: Na+/H+ antiporter NhaC family protein [Tenacibaculum]MCH3881397.1 sodium:solute symporter [Tenacibaculum aquimarinum]MDO6599009.1 Na+/H+ antiporter NhaC family protein [Tenacibaculum sp. 1_MG-2023]
MEYGFLSVLPPIVAIILALRTKQVYIALLFGIWFSWLIIEGWNPIVGTMSMIEGMVDVFQSKGNTRTIMFSALVGALLIFIQYSKGVEGFVNLLQKWMVKFENKKAGHSRVMVQVLATLTGLLLFVETSISSLTVGTLYRPIFDKLGIPREKLAYIADSSSAPSSILIPFNAWGAFIMGLLLTQGIEKPFSVLISSIKYNFYPLLAIAIVFIVIFSKKDFKLMAKAEKRTKETGELMNPNSKPMVSDEVTSYPPKEGIKAKAYNMIVPLLVMVFMMPINLIYTGWSAVESSTSFLNHVQQAIGNGSGSSSVLYAVITALLVAMIMYFIQGIMKPKEMVSLTLKGISELMPLALLMLLAFAIGDACKALETGVYVADVTKDWLSPELLPAVVFIISSFIAFSTGTSWGTFAIMLAISVPMANIHGSDITIIVAATLGGGIFGDHCSPISDTSIIASMASASDHIDHVKTQLPYALIGGVITVIMYLIIGFMG